VVAVTRWGGGSNFDDNEVMNQVNDTGSSGDSDLFSSALSFLKQGGHVGDDVDEDRMAQHHHSSISRVRRDHVRTVLCWCCMQA